MLLCFNNIMELLKHTLFINLEHRKDRLEHAMNEFKILGIEAERVDAVKPKSGAVGCTMSHIKCLELAKKRDYDYVFIAPDRPFHRGLEDKFLEELEGKLIVHSNIFHPEKLKKIQEFDFNGEKFIVYEK
mgnify:CR=1 FL=1